jgi:hypothetical protein
VLSSRATALYKFVLPALLGVWFAGTVWAVGFAVEPGVPGIGAFRWFLAGIGAFVVGLLLWLHAGLKKVTLEGDSLVVSNFRDSVRVPLHDVARVTPSRFTNPESIQLDLVVPCSFGQRITFLPPQRWVRGFTPHPLAAELAALVQERRLGGAGPVAVLAPVPWRRIVLGGVAAAVAITVFFAAVGREIRASDSYREALALARSHAALVAAIGEPMEEAWRPADAHWSAQGGETRAALRFRLHGPRGSAWIDASSRYVDRAWRTERAVAHVECRAEPIDLLSH